MATFALAAVPNLSELVTRVAPRRSLADPFGIVSGYRAYVVYTQLSALGDVELAEMGLTRADLPRAAMEAIRATA